MRALHGALNHRQIIRRGAFVECHDDICAQFFLDLHRALRSEAVGRTVDVAFERDPVVIHLADVGQREHLEAARIGQHRVWPAHEVVQPAHLRHQIRTRAQIQVVGVRKHQRGAQLGQLCRGERFHRGLGADRCKNRGLQRAMRSVEHPRTCPSLPRRDLEIKALLRHMGWIILHSS